MVLQDPVWEQSFPDVERRGRPFVDAATGRVASSGCIDGEAAARREANEGTRCASCSRMLRALDMDPVLVSSHEHRDVVYSFPHVGRRTPADARASVRSAARRSGSRRLLLAPRLVRTTANDRARRPAASLATSRARLTPTVAPASATWSRPGVNVSSTGKTSIPIAVKLRSRTSRRTRSGTGVRARRGGHLALHAADARRRTLRCSRSRACRSARASVRARGAGEHAALHTLQADTITYEDPTTRQGESAAAVSGRRSTLRGSDRNAQRSRRTRSLGRRRQFAATLAPATSRPSDAPAWARGRRSCSRRGAGAARAGRRR